MKFSKIYIALSAVFSCLPIYVAYTVLTGHIPTFGSGFFPDASYIVPLKNSLLTALICAFVCSLGGTFLALFFTRLKEKFSVFFTTGSHCEVYIFNIIIFSVLWFIIYLNGKSQAFVTLAHCMICLPLVFCMVYGFSGDMSLTARCAAEIGSAPMQTFFNITLPSITPSVTAGFLCSFAVSFNDIIIALAVSRGTVQTFTMKTLEYVRNGTDTGSVCIVIMLCTLALTAVSAAICIRK